MAAIADHHDGLYGKSAAFSRPNAAPVLCTCVRSSSCGIMRRLSPSGSSTRTDRLGHLVERHDESHRAQLEWVRVAAGRCRLPAATAGATVSGTLGGSVIVSHPATVPLAPCSASTHRSQRPSMPEADDTDGTIRQHLGHLLPSARVTVTSTPGPSPSARRSSACDTMNSIARSAW